MALIQIWNTWEWVSIWLSEFKEIGIGGWKYSNLYNALTTQLVKLSPAILGGRPYASSADRPKGVKWKNKTVNTCWLILIGIVKDKGGFRKELTNLKAKCIEIDESRKLVFEELKKLVVFLALKWLEIRFDTKYYWENLWTKLMFNNIIIF